MNVVVNTLVFCSLSLFFMFFVIRYKEPKIFVKMIFPPALSKHNDYGKSGKRKIARANADNLIFRLKSALRRTFPRIPGCFDIHTRSKFHILTIILLDNSSLTKNNLQVVKFSDISLNFKFL